MSNYTIPPPGPIDNRFPVVQMAATAIVAGSLGSVAEGADFLPSVVALGIPAVVGKYVADRFIPVPKSIKPNSIQQTAWLIGGAGSVALLLLAITGQVAAEPDTATLGLVALLGGSGVLADYLVNMLPSK